MNRIIRSIPILFLIACSGQQKPDKKNTEPASVSVQEQTNQNQANTSVENASESEMIFLKGGSFLMGSETGLPNEKPVHEVTVKPFYMDKTPVTVAQFKKFAESQNYRTEAEKFGDSGVFNLERQTWELLPGATWKKPFGPSGPDAEDDHPVTHVSWNDAVAYAMWAGKRLPMEVEWEYAARSAKDTGNKFSWGNEMTTGGKHKANTWQGTLQQPATDDGFLFTSPVGAFGSNEAGLTDMGGNVWQWCADIYKPYPGNPEPYNEDPNVRVIRGGSFFFDQNGEDSFSVSGRAMNSHETSLFNTGFRCARSE